VSDEKSEQKGWWERNGLTVAVAMTVIVLAVGMVFYFGHIPSKRTVDDYSQLGDAMAPFAAVLTAFALLAALWSVKLQSAELALTRKEMKDSTAQLAEAAKAQKALAEATRGAVEQAKRTAEAQEALAAAQREHTRSVRIANIIAENAQGAQHAGRAASLTATIADLRFRPYQAPNPNYTETLVKTMKELLPELEKQRDDEALQARVSFARAAVMEVDLQDWPPEPKTSGL
jgi:hypothetical protein